MTEVLAQENFILDSLQIDTISKSIYGSRFQKIGSEGHLQSVEEFEMTRIHGIQRKVLTEIKNTVQESRKYLGSGVDSLDIESTIDLIKNQRSTVVEGIFENESLIQSDRNLAVSTAILDELLERIQTIRSSVGDRSDDLFRLSFEIDSLSSISELYIFPSDSVLAGAYAAKLFLLDKEIEPTLTALHFTLNSLEKLQTKAEEVLILLEASLLKIDRKRAELNKRLISKETQNFSGLGFPDISFNEAVKISFEKEILALGLYFQIYSAM